MPEAMYRQSLQEEAETMLSEARMVLPGIQALFGFQLIAVFSDRFEALQPGLQILHFGATTLVVIVVALMMAPAAYHRIAGRGCVSRDFLTLGSRLISVAMAPLAVAIALELFIVGVAISNDATLAVVVATLSLLMLAGAWLLMPLLVRAARRPQPRPGRAADVEM